MNTWKIIPMAHKRKIAEGKKLQKIQLKKPNLPRADRRRIKRQQEKKEWILKMKARGGFIPKRAKKWGDPCSNTECRMWEDGECQYSERDTKGCYLKLEGEYDIEKK